MWKKIMPIEELVAPAEGLVSSNETPKQLKQESVVELNLLPVILPWPHEPATHQVGFLL